MAKKVYEESNILAIADKIREKTGGDSTYKTSEMSSAIEEVYETGQQSEYDRFWDNYQDNGNRFKYEYAFSGAGWTSETFKPKYDISPTSTYCMFAGSCIGNLISALEKAGVILDTSKDTSTSYFMQNSKITHLPTYDARSRPNIDYFIYNNKELEYIEKIILKDDGSQKFNKYSFYENEKLKEIRFEGVIGNDISISSSPLLTHDSLMSVINALKDFSGSPLTIDSNISSDNVSTSYFPTKIIVDSNSSTDYILSVSGWDELNNKNGTVIINFLYGMEDMLGVSLTNKNIKSVTVKELEGVEPSIAVGFEIVYTPFTDSKTLTLGETNLAKLTDEEKAIATEKGWILA